MSWSLIAVLGTDGTVDLVARVEFDAAGGEEVGQVAAEDAGKSVLAAAGSLLDSHAIAWVPSGGGVLLSESDWHRAHAALLAGGFEVNVDD